MMTGPGGAGTSGAASRRRAPQRECRRPVVTAKNGGSRTVIGEAGIEAGRDPETGTATDMAAGIETDIETDTVARTDSHTEIGNGIVMAACIETHEMIAVIVGRRGTDIKSAAVFGAVMNTVVNAVAVRDTVGGLRPTGKERRGRFVMTDTTPGNDTGLDDVVRGR